MDKLITFTAGVDFAMLADAFWRAPDLYRYGEITRAQELLWLVFPLVVGVILYILANSERESS